MSGAKRNGQKIATKRLRLDDSICWIPRNTAPSELGICERQMRRDIDVLKEMEPEGFTYDSRKGFWRDTLEVMWQFRQLVERLGRGAAIAIINKHMEEFWNGYEGQASGGSSQESRK